ncbi:SGNH hydrolase-type esterase domain-containing protein [Xylogone sp. PMI_703]|nr:SGNH hydrolase-type esterase domain-containing protein [Xylogone sp. PMI_703]
MIVMNAFHILCFGDSLTEGFTRFGTVFHPYAWSLKPSLQKFLPSAVITTDIQGRSGDLVISPPGKFHPRIASLYENTEVPYNWTVVLGGTNDLNNGFDADEIYSALQIVWKVALDHGSNVLALTVPECGTCPPALDERRDKLNELILQHEATNFYTLDLHGAMPYWNMTEDQRQVLWDDGVHFTTEGYDLMGSIVSDRLFEIVSENDMMGEISSESLLGAGLLRQELKRRRESMIENDVTTEKVLITKSEVLDG